MVRLNGYAPQQATFRDKSEAKKWALKLEAEIRSGRYFGIESKKHLFSDIIERYQKTILPTQKERSRKFQFIWWKKQLGHYSLSDLTPLLIAQKRDQLSKNVSNGTVNQYLAALSHIFTICIKEYGILESNPVLKISKPKNPAGRVRFLSDAERARLLSACQDSRNDYLYLIVVLLLSTGARKMEIVDLKWSDIDFSRAVIVLQHTKNGERRVLPLSEKPLQLLQEHAILHAQNTPWVFPNRLGTGGIRINEAFQYAVRKACISDFRIHDLRHSAASYLAMNGASAQEIAAVLGHKTLQMVKRYAHLSEAHTAAVIGKMNEKIFS